eukprot:CAMPEP_0178423952 /NCGR_PEP_ID=MMETSP0689_2-20121128/27954_1 /TAXON_ID=160604 /ORGANISM="Amphidinium massartii, Strain CS-259" /LENGTH=203 /DNA_ID=CAMNT_0020045563 /DNA_START=10 /DNA_END=621 /DNA_ORIENTATION=+
MRAVALLSAGLCILNACGLSSSPCFGAAFSTLRGSVCKPPSRTCVHASVNRVDCAGAQEEALDGVILPAMHKKERQWLCHVLTRYWEDEWINPCVPFTCIHEALANTVAYTYWKSREAGDNEVTAVWAKLSSHLKDQFKEGMWGNLPDGIGPDDIANRAVEFVMLRSGLALGDEEVQAKLLKRLSKYVAYTEFKDMMQSRGGS